MKTTHLLAASILAVSCVFLSASCIQDPAAALEPESSQGQQDGSEPIGEAQQESSGPRFTLEDFIFVIEREWDGEDEAGGWQIAFNTSNYAVRVDAKEVYSWQCRMKIGMPRHTERTGDIPTNRAAALSAEIANAVTWPMLDRKKPWTGQGALFCIQQRAVMKKLFETRYRFVGATVEQG